MWGSGRNKVRNIVMMMCNDDECTLNMGRTMKETGVVAFEEMTQKKRMGADMSDGTVFRVAFRNNAASVQNVILCIIHVHIELSINHSVCRKCDGRSRTELNVNTDLIMTSRK